MTYHSKIKLLELFSGSGTLSKIFESAGHESFKVDIRKRSGVCEPDLKANIIDLGTQYFFNKGFNVVWASIPCTAFSFAAGNKYFEKGSIPKESARHFIELAKHSLQMIKETAPDLYFIENPRGHLNNQAFMKQFLNETGGQCHLITLGSYGFPSTKPTHIFTNAKFVPRPLEKYGRGAKSNIKIDNLTVCQRQKTPEQLANDILQLCEKTLLKK